VIYFITEVNGDGGVETVAFTNRTDFDRYVKRCEERLYNPDPESFDAEGYTYHTFAAKWKNAKGRFVQNFNRPIYRF
jgi:hypothetical protein